MRVIGTAGHVDHGKSTLIKRLTGIDPDRLAEEKARQMTIDLGFAWLDLPQSGRVGIVDVPGHRDFIENMLAGIGGIDLALLVIAADEGPMPQTLEHLAILDLLRIPDAVVALTKVDMASDPDWLALIQSDITDLLHRSHLPHAPIIPVSAVTGFGIEHLLSVIDERLNRLVETIPGRPGTPRLPVDRVFSMTGFGTVVTGTLRDGPINVGDMLEILPARLPARVRGIRSYEQPVERALPGSRVALNLSGIERSQVKRGDVIAPPNMMEPTTLVDARYLHLPAAEFELKHHALVKVFTGTTETIARLRLLDADTVAPGTEAWIQLQLDQPIAALDGDLFVLRRPSPAQTIGGGEFVRVHPRRKWKRADPAVIAALAHHVESQHTAQQIVLLASGSDPILKTDLQRRVALTADEFDARIRAAADRGLLLVLQRGGDALVWSAEAAQSRRQMLRQQLERFHQSFPLRSGMSREELRSRLKLKADTFHFLLATDAELIQEGSTIRLASHAVTFTGEQVRQREQLLQSVRETPFSPPSFSELTTAYGEDLVYALIDQGDLVRVAGEVVFAREAYDELVQHVTAIIQSEDSVTAAQVRDRAQTSRKFAIALLEHLDASGWTRRQGDLRVAGPQFREG